MTRKLFLLLFILLCMKQSTMAQSFDFVIREKGDSTKNLYYALIPDGEIIGCIILLPGFGVMPDYPFRESKIPDLAVEKGILTVVPSLLGYQTFYLDSSSQFVLDTIIDEVIQNYDIKDDKFVIGGFSLGGSGAIKYAERSFEDGSLLKKPYAVFAIDPPLDIERFYLSLKRSLTRSKNEIVPKEAKYFINRIENEFGKNPIDDPEFFWKISPYAYSDTSLENIRLLTKIPLRLYSEPDINWQIENRNRDYYGMNVLDCAAMINDLKLLGNSRAELIITSGKGFRKIQNQRNPHSWSIADEEELMEWILQTFSTQ